MEENNKSLITVNSSLAKIEKQIAIGEKIINKTIEELFNKAFKLISSKKIDIDSNHNYLSDFLKDETLLHSEKFSFVVQNDEDYIQALEIFDEIIELNGSFKLAYYFKGLIYKKNYNRRLSNEIYDLFLKKSNLDKTNDLFYIESIDNFSKVLEIDSEFVYALFERIDLYEKENIDLALIDCNKLIYLNPNYSDYYRIRANILIGLDKKKESINDFKFSLELDRNNIRAYNNLGRAYLLWSEKKELARENFLKAIELVENNLITDPNNPMLYYFIGYAKIGLLEFNDANFYLKKSVQIKSEFYFAGLLIELISNTTINNKDIKVDDLWRLPICMFRIY